MDRGDIIIAGIPRCGTTYLFRAIAGLKPGNSTPKEYVHRKKPFDTKYCKTHSLPNQILQENSRAIFLFGDIINAVISTKKNRYDSKHFKNCGLYNAPDDMDIYKKDWLGYENMFEYWYNYQGKQPVMCLRYETMPLYFDRIEEFVNKPIDFPKWEYRKTHTEPWDKLENIYRTYYNLKKKIDNAKDCKVKGGKM